MSKNIALFSDGTGNSSSKLFRTNVWRLYDALDLSRSDQIAYYDDGVGTSSFKPYALLGGALGLGLKRNVKDIYAFLSRSYQPGDQIYAFGFSRGAFTIRILIGFVHDQGLARGATEAELWRDVNAKWWTYRKRARTRVLGKIRTAIFGRRARIEAADSEVKFKFVGLWDTVAAYGLPVDELTRAWDRYVWPLSMGDRVPSTSIGKAFHALSIDDERQTFHPVLWTESQDSQNENSKHLDEERISQVWFSGVHSNVGGGYSDDALSYVPLCWIMNEAKTRGLDFRKDDLEKFNAAAASNGPMNDSRKGVAGYYRYNPRKIEKLTSDGFHRVAIKRPKIHASVFERMTGGGDRYAPIVLPERYAVVEAGGSIVNAAAVLESASQSGARGARQEQVWDLVWKRRVVYFLTLMPSLFLALFPFIFEAGTDGVCLSQYLCFLAKPIGWIGAALPGFASPWIDAFESNPAWFAVGVGALAFLLWSSARLKTRIKDEMRLIWQPILAAPMTEVASAARPSSWIYRLRTSKAYQALFHLLTRHVLPFLFAVGIYYGAAALLSQMEYSIVSALGAGCTATADVKPVAMTASFTFNTNERCAASKYRIEAGARYRIWIQIDADKPWADASIKTDLAGFSSNRKPWAMYAAVPFRRWVSQPWFKPIARIGERGNDEYPLEPAPGFGTNGAKDHMYGEILARRGGELFLYVNDVVWFWPWLDQYYNNHGKASVTIQRAEPPLAPSLSQQKGSLRKHSSRTS
jgi:uncharacterized protein (DUF2235 family)